LIREAGHQSVFTKQLIFFIFFIFFIDHSLFIF